MESRPPFLSNRVKRGDYYFLNLTPDPEQELEVVCGGREVCGEDYVVDRTGFRWWSVEYVASGHGQARLGGRTVPLVPGTLLYYGPQTPHRLQVEPGSSMVKYFVDFVGRQSQSLLEAAFGSAPSVVAGASVQRLFEDLKAYAETLSDTRSAVCGLVVRQLLALLPDKAMASAVDNRELRTKYQAIKQRLAEKALEGLSVAEVAQECHVSPSYLARLFRQFDDETPHQYLLRCRMAFAASLLLDRHLLVKEVAQMTGYEDQYQFSRAFKRVYGQSPQQLRTLRE